MQSTTGRRATGGEAEAQKERQERKQYGEVQQVGIKTGAHGRERGSERASHPVCWCSACSTSTSLHVRQSQEVQEIQERPNSILGRDLGPCKHQAGSRLVCDPRGKTWRLIAAEGLQFSARLFPFALDRGRKYPRGMPTGKDPLRALGANWGVWGLGALGNFWPRAQIGPLKLGLFQV